MKIAHRIRKLRNALLHRIRATLFPKRYWVATYGDMGLDVRFFHSRAEYDAAVEEADDLYERGQLDSYVHGEMDHERY